VALRSESGSYKEADMRGRHNVLAGLIGAVIAAGASTAVAGVAGGFGERSFTPTQVLVGWNDNSGSTNAKAFAPLSVDVAASGHGPALVTVTGRFSGGEMALRVVANGHVLKPGPMRIQPADLSGQSLTYVWPGGAGKCTRFKLQWKSVTGDRIRFNRANMAVTYQSPTSGSCR
jgi:hypothetical protein